MYTCTMTKVTPRRPRSPKAAAGRRAPIDGLLSPDLFKALADPTRVRLLACLAKCARPCAVGEIAECCSVDLSVVSRHLSLLERAGVVHASKVGRTVSYAVRYTHVAALLRALADAFDQCCPADTECDGASCGCAPARPPTGSLP